MSLQISPENEARLNTAAKELGLSVDALVEKLLDDTRGLPEKQRIRLPSRYIGVHGSLRRQDLYDDLD